VPSERLLATANQVVLEIAMSSYEALKVFLATRMRMSHLYQPVMLRRLLLNGGSASRREIARDILDRDPTQLEYYERIVRDMVGRVLTSKRDMVSRTGDTYELVGASSLAPGELQDLVALCDQQIAAYEARRGAAIWEHRRRGQRAISGTVRYEVLKRARGRCELCGVSHEVKALEVDHILPRKHRGSDDISNLQALCYTCNASKRDRDDTDFRGWRDMYAHREPGCVFCEVADSDRLDENELAFARADGFPVTAGHELVIPRRHVQDFFSLTQPELNAVHELLSSRRAAIAATDPTVAGFNVGVNGGVAAGQTVMHCHVHLIPRRLGDVECPRGGVRHVVPGRGNY
jgi:diadenosine tetraphosphate (Ap4A) HIT family hydrolase